MKLRGKCNLFSTRPQFAHAGMWKNYPYDVVISWVLLTQCVYGEVLVSTLPTDLSVSIWTFVHVAIAGLLAQLAGTASIRIAEFILPMKIHSPMCREWGAAQVFVGSVLQTSCLYEPSLVATVLLPSFLACNVLVVYTDWMLWAPSAKRPAGLPQPNCKRPRQQQVDVEISSLQHIDTTIGNTQKRHKPDYAHVCNKLATHLTRVANKDISSHFVKGRGLSFEVSLDYLGESVDNHRIWHFNFVWEASIGHRVMKTSCFKLRTKQVQKLEKDIKAEKANPTLPSFPLEWITFARACELPELARNSAESVAKVYDGVHIECRYLGVETDNASQQSASACENNYVEHPLEWPDIGNGILKQHREVRYIWSLQLPGDKCSDNTSDDEIYTWRSKIISSQLNHILERRKFCEPDGLYDNYAKILMREKARTNSSAPCIFERLFSKDGYKYVEFTWPGVYEDAQCMSPYRSTPRLKSMMLKSCRAIPGNPTTAERAEVLTFTVEFFDQLAAKFKMSFGGAVTFSNQCVHPRLEHKASWIEHVAPRQLDADCIWILESGRAMCNPADEIVVCRKREKIFDIDPNRTLEDLADHFYHRKLGFKEMAKDNPCINESWVKQMETTSGRNRIACMRFGYFACLGIPRNEDVFLSAIETGPKLQDEPWSTTTWRSSKHDCEDCWWVVNAPFDEAQVLLACVFINVSLQANLKCHLRNSIARFVYQRPLIQMPTAYTYMPEFIVDSQPIG